MVGEIYAKDVKIGRILICSTRVALIRVIVALDRVFPVQHVSSTDNQAARLYGAMHADKFAKKKTGCKVQAPFLGIAAYRHKQQS